MIKKLALLLIGASSLGAMVNPKELKERLIVACRDNDTKAIEEALVLEADVNGDYNEILHGITPLKCAARYNSLDAAKLLLKKGAKVNAYQDGLTNSGSALQAAAEYGHEEMAKLLLEHKAEVNACNHFKQTPLSSAAENGHLGLVKLLVNHGADPNIEAVPYAIEHINKHLSVKLGFSGLTNPLASAVLRYDDEMIDFLIRHGAKVNRMGISDMTLLELAYQHGDNHIINLLESSLCEDSLLESAGAQLPKREQMPPVKKDLLITALLYRSFGYKSMNKLVLVRKLIALGADLEAVDEQYKATPLLWAADSGSTEICKLLIDAGANLLAKNKDGLTALDCARIKGHIETVKVLQQAMKTPRRLDEQCLSLVRTLLKEGTISSENVGGANPLDTTYALDRVLPKASDSQK